ncbi:DUF4145 domain-containing protein [Desulfobacterales bacterium HSG2]|nr:DUF4145 domain-containing protein [Desulfobacterales bacterium HSG2]
MSRTQKIKIVDPEGKEIWAPCACCGKKTAHEALTEVDLHDESALGDIQVSKQEYIIKCKGCKTVSFCEESQCSEELRINEDGEQEPVNIQKVYPGIAGRPLLEDYYLLPYGVAKIYKQTHAAISDKLSILAGIGLRAIVEGVCKERSASGKNLFKKIDNLVEQGVITPDGRSILHEIRMMGNDAAHEVKANSDEELVTALLVVENLLENVYIIPVKAKKIRGKQV